MKLQNDQCFKVQANEQIHLRQHIFSSLHFLLLVFFQEGKKVMKSGRHENPWCPFCPMMPSQFYDSLDDCSDCFSVISAFPLKQYWSFDVSNIFFQKVRQFEGGGCHDPRDQVPLGIVPAVMRSYVKVSWRVKSHKWVLVCQLQFCRFNLSYKIIFKNK